MTQFLFSGESARRSAPGVRVVHIAAQFAVALCLTLTVVGADAATMSAAVPAKSPGPSVIPIPQDALKITVPASWSLEHYEGPSAAVKARVQYDLAHNKNAARLIKAGGLQDIQLLANDYASQARYSNEISITNLGAGNSPDTMEDWRQYADQNEGFPGQTTTATTFEFDGHPAYDAVTSGLIGETGIPHEHHTIYLRSGTQNVQLSIGLGGDLTAGRVVLRQLLNSLIATH